MTRFKQLLEFVWLNMEGYKKIPRIKKGFKILVKTHLISNFIADPNSSFIKHLLFKLVEQEEKTQRANGVLHKLYKAVN